MTKYLKVKENIFRIEIMPHIVAGEIMPHVVAGEERTQNGSIQCGVLKY